jgi:hypothetical protein
VLELTELIGTTQQNVSSTWACCSGAASSPGATGNFAYYRIVDEGVFELCGRSAAACSGRSHRSPSSSPRWARDVELRRQSGARPRAATAAEAEAHRAKAAKARRRYLKEECECLQPATH